MQRLKPSVQCYAWGKQGKQSKVAELCSNADNGVNIEENQPYAELWMGTHPKGPCLMHSTNEPLNKWLSANADVLGQKLAAKLEVTDNGITLPLLFKVLSVNKALSIQSHPTKEQAVVLHAQDPKNYPDPNHKPEMAIALTPFEMLCGFRPLREIYENIQETPELFEFIGGDAFMQMEALKDGSSDSNEARDALRACFTKLMSQHEVAVQRNVKSMVDRVALRVASRQQRGQLPDPNADKSYVLSELLIRLNYHYPGDIGVFAPLFLNHFMLQPGEACFLAPNEPHAYLFGDCIECMACSDNTIRAGLTPKYKDVDTLCASLTYRMSPPQQNMFTPHVHPQDTNVMVYDPPVPEFTVHRIRVDSNGAYNLLPLPVCSLLIVIEGSSTYQQNNADVSLSTGHVMLIPAGSQPIGLTLTQTPFVAFRAFTDESTIEKL